MRVAATAESIVPYCVNTITGKFGCVSCTRFNNSSPLVCGSIKSVSTMSIAVFSTTSMASSAVATVVACMPLICATFAHASRIVGSSSTTSTWIAAVSRGTTISSLIIVVVIEDSPCATSRFVGWLSAYAVPIQNNRYPYEEQHLTQRVLNMH